MMRPIVVGIYGVSGCGKSQTLSEIRKSRPEWRCLEGSDVIKQVLQRRGEDFNVFQEMDHAGKTVTRNQAMDLIQGFAGVTIIAGHCSFPKLLADDTSSENLVFEDVFTKRDAETYNAILYLDVDPSSVLLQREADNANSKRIRPVLSADMLGKWVEHEKELLRRECEKNEIHFATIQHTEAATYIAMHVLNPLIPEVQQTSEDALRASLRNVPQADVFLLVDGDRTLCQEDTGKIFFEKLNGRSKHTDEVVHLKQIFKRYPNYTFQAFLEVAMLYTNILSEAEYLSLSAEIGKCDVTPYEQWVSFLSNLPTNVHPILVSSGSREIWEAILEQHGLLEEDTKKRISIIAGNQLSLHSYVVDDRAKEIVARELRYLWGGCKIVSFGDSVVDVPMLLASDRGYIAIDDRRNRSMSNFILGVVSTGNSRIYQLPMQALSKQGETQFASSFLHDGVRVGSLSGLQQELVDGTIHRVVDFTSSTASAVLATKSRRSDVCGPALQDIHREIGLFLADKLLEEYGRINSGFVQEVDCPHVQGKTFRGWTTDQGTRPVLILPLMRGGEPMSRGVHQRFPAARLVHWDNDSDYNSLGLESLPSDDIIIVDSVINEGNSVRRVIQHLLQNGVAQSCRIHVLTAVMQREASHKLPLEFPRVRFLALRVSDNKYTGSGGTDTGNRLFGTV